MPGYPPQQWVRGIRRDTYVNTRTVRCMSSTEMHAGLRGRVLSYRPELDGLRALSLLVVLTGHLGTSSFRYGFLGVDVFFVLSGFLITELLCRSTTGLGTFYRRRFARLAPALIVMVVLVTAVGALGLWSLPWWAPVLALCYLMNFVGFFTSDKIADPLTPTWSLAAEEQYYLFWPLVMTRMIKQVGKRRTAHALMATTALIIVAQYALWESVSLTTLRHGPFFRPAGLLIGSAVALYGPLTRRGDEQPRTWILLPLAALVTLVGVIDSNGIFVSLATALVLVALNTPDAPTALVVRGLSNRVLTAIGRRSYSLYLWNLPSMFLATRMLGVGLPAVLTGLLLTFAIGSLSFRFVEIPMLKKFTRSTEKSTTS